MAKFKVAGASVTPEPIVLKSSRLSLVAEPARGGRITSVRHLPSAKEILWQQARHDDWPRYGIPESEADLQGWDECCPAIGPGAFPQGPWESVHNPAQGEVYALPWQVHDSAARRVTMSVHGVRFPYKLVRTIELTDDETIRLDYRITNHSALPLPFIWSAHPMLAAPAGGRIELPEGCRAAIVDSSDGGRLGAAYDRVLWPEARSSAGALARLDDVRPGSGTADKLYITDVPIGQCCFVRHDGPRINLTWDPLQIPYLGIWVDTRFAGSPQVALEPCLGYPDLMVEAARWGRHSVLPAFGERSWSYSMTISEPDK
jgi:galactose mutarotase-like enzyme